MEIQVYQKLDIPEIVKVYGRRLFGFIRRRVNRLEDAEDILQEVFFQLTEADRLMKPIDQMTAWLFTVARNRITDLYRKRKPDFLFDLEFPDDDDQLLTDIGELLIDQDDNPDTVFIRSLIRDELASALEDLPDKQRQVFELTEFQGKSFKEIARRTGEPVNTLISRKHYAVIYLRERLRILYDDLINI